jgi:hypothetical protein
MKTETDPFLAYYEGRDAAPDAENPYPVGSAAWHGWKHGHETEQGAGRPMPVAEVEAAFADLNRKPAGGST